MSQLTSYGLDTYNQSAEIELAQPLRAHDGGDTTPKVFCIGSYGSNAWKSSNPNSGVYESDIAKTIDSAQGCNPACNQGGTAIVECIGVDPYNLSVTGDDAATLGVNCGISTERNGVLTPLKKY